jgi:hypothetical protein
VAGLIAVSFMPRTAEAELRDPLVLAEEAYDQVDFEAALTLATEAIEGGQRSQQEMTRLYELISMCAAALDRVDEAREAYTRMLALNPDADVDASLAPRIRTIFLEASGSWVTRRGRLAAEATPLFERGELRVDLSDPLAMGHTVVVRVRVDRAGEYREHSEAAIEHAYVEVPSLRGATSAELIVRVLDVHGNRVVEVGTDDEPLVVRAHVAPRVDPPQVAAPDRPVEPTTTPVTRRPWFWAVIGTAALVVVGGSVAAGVVVGTRTNSIGAETEVTIGVR